MTDSDKLLTWLAQCFVEAYLDDCIDRALSPKTISWYRWHLERGIAWLAAEPGCSAIDLITAPGVPVYYRSTRDLARSTRRHLVSAWSAFGSWLSSHGLDNPAAHLKRPKKQRRLPRILLTPEVSRLLRALTSEPLRERALIHLLLDAGLRISEAANLQRHDVDLDSGQIIVRNGKGGKDRTAYISATTAHTLSSYLASHDSAHVFIAERGKKPVQPGGLSQAIRRLADRHGLNFSPHDLRRTCGTQLVLAGVDVSTIADQLGHEDLETARLYIRLADEARRQVIRAASPVERRIAANGILIENWPTRSSD